MPDIHNVFHAYLVFEEIILFLRFRVELKSRDMRAGSTASVVSDTADFDIPQFQANPILDVRNTEKAFSHFFSCGKTIRDNS